MLSQSLGSMSKPERLNRQQDLAIIEISQTENCAQLYALVEKNRQVDDTNEVSLTDFLNFDKYRSAIALLNLKVTKMEHVRLHEIMEPAKFKEINTSQLFFYRWRPEYRIPLFSDNQYDYWEPINTEDEQQKLEVYKQNHEDDFKLIIARHRIWTKHNTCFILPLTLEGEALLRETFIPDNACRINFSDILLAESSIPKISLQSNHHYGATGGIVFGSLAGKYIAVREFPVWNE